MHAVLEAGSALYRPVMMQFSEMVPHSLQGRDCLTDFALRMFEWRHFLWTFSFFLGDKTSESGCERESST